MADTQTVKFVYNKDVQVIDKVLPNNKCLVRSSGIYSAIREMSSSALLDSGYVGDCIISIDKSSTVNIVDGEITLGSEEYDSTFFIPNGFNDEGVPQFSHYTLLAGSIVTDKRHLKYDTVTTCDLAVLYDYEENKILLNPTRTCTRDSEGNRDGGFAQYVFARYQNKSDPENGYGPRTDKQTVQDEWTIWWDLTENKMKVYTNGSWVYANYSIPVALVSYVDGNIVGFANDFTVAGYLERAVWINPGVTFNFPKGRDINTTNTIICDPLTSGMNEASEPTYQPVVTFLNENQEDVTLNLTYNYSDEDPSKNVVNSINLLQKCLDEDSIKISVSHNGDLYETLDPESYKMSVDGKMIIFLDSITVTYSEEVGRGFTNVIVDYIGEASIIQQFEERFYDENSTTNNVISHIKLDRRCLDVETLTVKYTRGGTETIVPVGTYSLAEDARTIIFDNPIVLQNSDDEQNGGIIFETEFYETDDNMPMLVTNTWEIIGPTDEYSFDNTKGLYVNAAGESIIACRFAVLSTGYIVPKNLRAEEPLSITVFTPRTCFTLADNDDIENIMALIGSATGETMDQVLTNLEQIESEIQEMDSSHLDLVEETKKDILRTVDENYVHNTGNETIKGIKTFETPIVADLQGTASSVKKVFGSVELMPMGVCVQYNTTETGTSGEEFPNPETFLVNDIRVDGSLQIICVNDSATADDIAELTEWKSLTEYSKGDKFYVSIEADEKYKIFEVQAGIGTDEDPNHVYTDSDLIGVMNTGVRIGSDYVVAKTFKGEATSAKWADLAEIYEADADYAPGTLIMFGGEKEITLANFGYAHGVISSKPAYLMNSSAKGLPVAMIGRVPVRVFGAISKFDKIYMDLSVPGVATRMGAGEPIGIALESNDFSGEKLVECVVKLKL